MMKTPRESLKTTVFGVKIAILTSNPQKNENLQILQKVGNPSTNKSIVEIDKSRKSLKLPKSQKTLKSVQIEITARQW